MALGSPQASGLDLTCRPVSAASSGLPLPHRGHRQETGYQAPQVIAEPVAAWEQTVEFAECGNKTRGEALNPNQQVSSGLSTPEAELGWFTRRSTGVYLRAHPAFPRCLPLPLVS